jgi:hypothetical protein
MYSRAAKRDCIALLRKTAARGKFIATTEDSQQGQSCAMTTTL